MSSKCQYSQDNERTGPKVASVAWHAFDGVPQCCNSAFFQILIQFTNTSNSHVYVNMIFVDKLFKLLMNNDNLLSDYVYDNKVFIDDIILN